MMTLLQQQPLFDLHLDTFGLGYHVAVNGSRVVHDLDLKPGQFAATFPVNHWMHPSDNSVTVNIFPPGEGEPINPRSRLSLTLTIRELNQPEVEFSIPIFNFVAADLETDSETASSLASGHYTLNQTGLVADEQGTIKIDPISKTPRDDYDGAFSWQRDFVLENSLPLWRFFDSERLPNYYEYNDADYEVVLDELFAIYMKIQNALASGDIEPILPMFDERNRETDAAFYKTPGATAARLRELMLEDINSDDVDLARLLPDFLSITLEEGNMRLVSLMREGFTDAIGYNYKGGGSTNYPITLRREDGQWIITR